MGKGQRNREAKAAREFRTREGLANWAAMVGEVVVRLKHGKQENVNVILNPTECGVLLEVLVVMQKANEEDG